MDESTDVSDPNQVVIAELDNRLKDWFREFGEPVGVAGRAEFDADTEYQLRELGYLP